MKTFAWTACLFLACTAVRADEAEKSKDVANLVDRALEKLAQETSTPPTTTMKDNPSYMRV